MSIYKSNLGTYGSHAGIVSFITDYSTVLDVGCSSGYLMDFLIKDRSCTCIGIEPNLLDYKNASQSGLEVLNSTAENAFKELSDQGAKFKHIIFGDVLEHMVIPEVCIKGCVELLDDDGTIIVSLPNIVSLLQE